MLRDMCRWLGVDVGGKKKGFDVAAIDDRRLLALAGRLDRAKVLSLIEQARPTIVAIDSPRTCAPSGQTTRDGERELVAKDICHIRWTPDETQVYARPYFAWVVEGLALYEALSA